MLAAVLFSIAAIPFSPSCITQYLLVPMDEAQTDHLRAYGLTYWCLEDESGGRSEWLLNYRYGSFLLPDTAGVRARAAQLGVTVEPVSEADYKAILATIAEENMERIVLEKGPKIAVYIPPAAEPWDDAVTLALEYAEIPYDKLYDADILEGKLADYDWLHTHHEDFSGQFGKFWANFRQESWYQQQVNVAREDARRLGFRTVQQLKAAVAASIAQWVANGGFLFAMCSACDSLDVALAATDVDIIPPEIDGTPVDPAAQERLNYEVTFCFRDFQLVTDAAEVEIADIDITPPEAGFVSGGKTFELFEFSAKQDPVVTMLTQCHTTQIPDFLGLTTSFNRARLKDNVVIMGERPGTAMVKYIHVDYGEGTATYLGGHDPEDYAHVVGEEPTDLSLHKHSPGYRLILNNILFPAAKPRERKT
ncbi:MAG: asparagine synthetase B [Candidatus Zipacnadales bacterium]